MKLPICSHVLFRIFAGTALLTGLALAQENSSAVPLGSDPAKVLGHESCAKCHTAEVQLWQQTPHATTFETLHRTAEAKEILGRLGLRAAKRNDTCVQCHYTQQQQESRLRTISGVSCESCHGASANWINLHADYGGPGVTADSESPEHRLQRREASIAAGMNNPANLYLIARQCYGCHTVGHEELVNVGGHQAGSREFELVAWSQGRVRHNYLRGGGSHNAPATLHQLRVMYLVGVMADLEFSLRATARATQFAKYGKTCAERAANRKRHLREIDRWIDDPHLKAVLDAVATLELKLGNGAAISSAADRVGTAALAFAEEADGDLLSAIDTLLPDPRTYK